MIMWAWQRKKQFVFSSTLKEYACKLLRQFRCNNEYYPRKFPLSLSSDKNSDKLSLEKNSHTWLPQITFCLFCSFWKTKENNQNLLTKFFLSPPMKVSTYIQNLFPKKWSLTIFVTQINISKKFNLKSNKLIWFMLDFLKVTWIIIISNSTNKTVTFVVNTT